MTDPDLTEPKSGDPEGVFVWPCPPYFQLPGSDTASAPEQCVIHYLNGTQACGQTGYRGRLGIHELFVAHPAIKRQIQTKAFAGDILAAAIDAGMRTLKQNGMETMLRGDTDLQQVRAVCA